MGGVDLADQQIAYYHPYLRCLRNWIPMCIQIISIIKNNSYIVHQNQFKGKASKHKKFTTDMITHLMNKAYHTPAEAIKNQLLSSKQELFGDYFCITA